MESKRDVPANVGSSLEHLIEMQGIINPEIVDLHHEVYYLLKLEAGGSVDPGPGEDKVTSASTACVFRDKIYNVKGFVRRSTEGPFDETELETGLRFFPPDFGRTGLYTDLTFYGKGVMLAGINDREDEDEIAATIAFAKELVNDLGVNIRKKKHANQRLKEKKEKRVRRFLGRMTAIGTATAALAAGAYGLSSEGGKDLMETARTGVQPVIDIFRGRSHRFDDHNYRLSGGAVARIGEAVTPFFSIALYNDTRLSVSKLPRVNHKVEGSDWGDSKYPFDGDLKPSDGLREIILTSSEDGDNCRTAGVEYITPDSKLISWTDFVNIDGSSRANELTIKLLARTPDTPSPVIEACWHGDELSDEDDPRIVFDIRN